MAVVDRDRAERALAEFLMALGHDADDLRDTPARVTSAFADELLSGYGVDVPRLIEEGSEPTSLHLDPVLVGPIPTHCVCPHHLLIAEGEVSVGYEPGSRVLGLGTLSRLVAAYSRRLVLQETIAGQVVEALMHHGGAQGAFCRVQLRHACLRCRGVRQSHANTVTWASRGTLLDVERLRLILGQSDMAPGRE